MLKRFKLIKLTNKCYSQTNISPQLNLIKQGNNNLSSKRLFHQTAFQPSSLNDLVSNLFTTNENSAFTENGSPTHKSSKSGLVDFFYFTVKGISQTKIHEKLNNSWEENPLFTLKIIFFIRDVVKGKKEKEIFYECIRWLAINHPQTLLENFKSISYFGYWKDYLEILRYLKFGGSYLDERQHSRYYSKFYANKLARPISKQFVKLAVEKTRDFDLIFKEAFNANVNPKQLVLNYDEYEASRKMEEELRLEQKTLKQKMFKERNDNKNNNNKSKNLDSNKQESVNEAESNNNISTNNNSTTVDVANFQDKKRPEILIHEKVYKNLVKKYKEMLDQVHLSKIQFEKQKLTYDKLYDKVIELFVTQLKKDLEILKKKSQDSENNKHLSVSLCAKWAPSVATSFDKELNGIAKKIAYAMFPYGKEEGIQLTERKEGKGDEGFTDEQVYRYLAKIKYQKEVLTPLRKETPVIETYMSQNRWNELPYERVPSVCMKNCKKLFENHDADRFLQFLSAVEKGEKKIASKALFPHQILSPFINYGCDSLTAMEEKTIELQWKDMVEQTKKESKGLLNIMPVCDVSGSMACCYGSPSPLEVCISLGILCAQVNNGVFHNKLCTFSSTPEFFDISAKDNNVPKEEMIKKILIFSDMQFDSCCTTNTANMTTDFEMMKMKFEKSGYEMPQVIFWNLNGNYENVPVTVDSGTGVGLMSGFSSSLLQMINDDNFDILQIIGKCISGKRYEKLIIVD
ncbi:hypothetical protein ABK040_008568 [Willaertia magna]